MNGYRIGFEVFAQKTATTYSPVLEEVKTYFTQMEEMSQNAPSQLLDSLVRLVSLTVSNSYQSVLLLTMNGCGSDALKIARSMFESSVAIAYLQKYPHLVNDFVDYRWVKRHKHQEFLAQYAPDNFKAIDPAQIALTIAEYARVKARFKGRQSWSDKNLREMAKDLGVEQSYLGIYPFTSSVHHLDVIGIMAQEDANDIEVLPSAANIYLALSISGLSAYIVLACYDEAKALGKEAVLKEWLSRYFISLTKVSGAT